MGAVWCAWDERLERWVALKQIRADQALSHARERLRREARAVARLNHPAIVHVYDILEGEDGDWIVMELVAGKTLRCQLAEETALSPECAVKLCGEIAEGLAEAHAHGILHRDLKASNVIVAPSGRAKILDFGLAKEMPREDGPEGQELTISTPATSVSCSTWSPGCWSAAPEALAGARRQRLHARPHASTGPLSGSATHSPSCRLARKACQSASQRGRSAGQKAKVRRAWISSRRARHSRVQASRFSRGSR
jgi:serine/threonine protein kinase